MPTMALFMIQAEAKALPLRGAAAVGPNPSAAVLRTTTESFCPCSNKPGWDVRMATATGFACVHQEGRCVFGTLW